jgi:hypothetical protein
VCWTIGKTTLLYPHGFVCEPMEMFMNKFNQPTLKFRARTKRGKKASDATFGT